MNSKYEQVVEILKNKNQKHIIKYIDKLDMNMKDKIYNQVLNIDFDELDELYKKTKEEMTSNIENLEPISGIDPKRLSEKEVKDIEKIGADIIKANKYAVATMAGGQGTRLRSYRTKRNI